MEFLGLLDTVSSVMSEEAENGSEWLLIRVCSRSAAISASLRMPRDFGPIVVAIGVAVAVGHIVIYVDKKSHLPSGQLKSIRRKGMLGNIRKGKHH